MGVRISPGGLRRPPDDGGGGARRGPEQALRPGGGPSRAGPRGAGRRGTGYPGPNGAGNTTTIRLLPGPIKPTAGQAEIFGLDVQAEKVAVHARVAYVPGEATPWPSLTGAETLHLLATNAEARCSVLRA